jgi:hypothetical protein
MGLLDDLQNEARQIKVREARQKVELAAQDEFYRTQLRPVMLRAYEYYAELIENLSIVVPDITATYPLNPLLDSDLPLRQANYKIKLDNRETPRQIDIFCQCILASPYKFYLPGQKAVQNLSELLENYNFTHRRKNHLDLSHKIRGATFVLEGPMTAHVRLAVNPSGRNIHIIFRNVERIPLNRYAFPPEAVDDELIERVAKVLLRQVPVLVDRKVDASVRDQQRSQIEPDEYKVSRADREGERRSIDRNKPRPIIVTARTVAERARNLLKLFSASEA